MMMIGMTAVITDFLDSDYCDCNGTLLSNKAKISA